MIHQKERFNRVDCVRFRLVKSILRSTWVILSYFRAIIFLHYRVAIKMALETLGYTMCRVPLEVSKLVYHIPYMLDWRGWIYFPRKSTVGVLIILKKSFFTEFVSVSCRYTSAFSWWINPWVEFKIVRIVFGGGTPSVGQGEGDTKFCSFRKCQGQLITH